jgi:hypothetical protein
MISDGFNLTLSEPNINEGLKLVFVHLWRHLAGKSCILGAILERQDTIETSESLKRLY